MNVLRFARADGSTGYTYNPNRCASRVDTNCARPPVRPGFACDRHAPECPNHPGLQMRPSRRETWYYCPARVRGAWCTVQISVNSGEIAGLD